MWQGMTTHDTSSAAAGTPPQLSIRLLTMEDATRLLPVSERTLYRKMRAGTLPHLKVGQKVLFLEDELIEAFRRAG